MFEILDKFLVESFGFNRVFDDVWELKTSDLKQQVGCFEVPNTLDGFDSNEGSNEGPIDVICRLRTLFFDASGRLSKKVGVTIHSLIFEQLIRDDVIPRDICFLELIGFLYNMDMSSLPCKGERWGYFGSIFDPLLRTDKAPKRIYAIIDPSKGVTCRVSGDLEDLLSTHLIGNDDVVVAEYKLVKVGNLKQTLETNINAAWKEIAEDGE